MGFLSDRKAEAKEAVAKGQPETAADLVVHALLEGPGTFSENLEAMTSGDDD